MEGLIALVVVVVLAIPVAFVVLLWLVVALRRRVASLEEAVNSLRARPAGAEAAAPDTTSSRAEESVERPLRWSEPAADAADPGLPDFVVRPAPVPPAPISPAPISPAAPLSAPPPLPATPPLPRAAAERVQPRSQPSASADAPAAAPGSAPASAPRPPEPTFFSRMFATVRDWFTQGNVPVKIGMLVLLAGVASALKYASDQGLLSVPIELRLAGISVGALGLLILGWVQRERRQMFARALQGGAIGVLLLVIFAAFKRFEMIPAVAAFAASIALVAGLCVLAVVQHSRTLAVLGILAGFMAPLWLSTGSGNHVGLFSYYAVLNAGIFAIAWYRPWRVLNLLGFAFTFGIGTLWGVLQYAPEHFASTEPFLLLFFGFYLLIPLFYARRQPARERDLVDGSLVFGTPLLAFSLQAGMLHDQPMMLALSAVAMALIYAVLARLLIGRPSWRVLAQSHAVLAVGLGTLAVPLALSARATAGVFALEGAGLVWLGLRQQRWLPQVSGALLQLAAAFAFVVGADHWNDDVYFLANATGMSGLLLALGGLASAWSCRAADRHDRALVFYLWGLVWWLGTMTLEIARFSPDRTEADALLVLAAVTGWLAAEAWRRWGGRALALTTLVMLLAAFPLALVQVDMHQHPFAGHGGPAWAVFAVLGLRALWCLRGGAGHIAVLAQGIWWVLWPSLLSLLGLWISDRAGLAQGWGVALVMLPWLVLAAITLRRWSWLRPPLGAAFDPARTPLQSVVFAVLALGWLGTQLLPGWAQPLPWMPLINPAELVQWAALLLAARWLYAPDQAPAALRRQRATLVAVAVLTALTSAVLHGVHHWGRVPWNPGLLSTGLAQTSLTLLWSVLGVVAWVWGSRRGQRMVWLAGAVLMAVVLCKLVLIDRQHLGNLPGIASFIGYGLLCTVVGYLAPAPPRHHPVSETKE